MVVLGFGWEENGKIYRADHEKAWSGGMVNIVELLRRVSTAEPGSWYVRFEADGAKSSPGDDMSRWWQFSLYITFPSSHSPLYGLLAVSGVSLSKTTVSSASSPPSPSFR
jgi:hypothetical protein